MSIWRALPYKPLRPYNDKEWSTLTHIILNLDIDWDPTYLECEEYFDNWEWFYDLSSFPDAPNSKLFNEYGDHKNVSDYHELHFFDTKTFK